MMDDVRARLDAPTVIAAYTHTADAGEIAAWVELLTDDGNFEGYADDLDAPLLADRGRSPLTELIERQATEQHASGTISVHCQGPVEFLEVTETSARTRTRVLVGWSRRGEPPAPPTAGTYHDTFRCVERRRRIAERVLYLHRAVLAAGPRPSAPARCRPSSPARRSAPTPRAARSRRRGPRRERRRRPPRAARQGARYARRPS